MRRRAKSSNIAGPNKKGKKKKNQKWVSKLVMKGRNKDTKVIMPKETQ